MAANYIRELIAEKAGTPAAQRASLIDSLKELFHLFFPGKEFLGPRPTKDGKLSFNVKTLSGQEHDINELSSGEREVLSTGKYPDFCVLRQVEEPLICRR